MGWTGFFGRNRFSFFLERESLLFSFPANPTVGGLRGEKRKRSTRNRLRVDSGFSEFLQTPRGRISPYLGFIPIIKCFTNVSVVWGRLIGPKTWDRIYKIFGRKNAAPRLILV